jgi:hypothetical protein
MAHGDSSGLMSGPPAGSGEVFLLDIPFYRTRQESGIRNVTILAGSFAFRCSDAGILIASEGLSFAFSFMEMSFLGLVVRLMLAQGDLAKP